MLPDPSKSYTTQELMDYAPWTVNSAGKYAVSVWDMPAGAMRCACWGHVVTGSRALSGEAPEH